MNTSISTPIFQFVNSFYGVFSTPASPSYPYSAVPVLFSRFRSPSARFAFLRGAMSQPLPPNSNTGGNDSQPDSVSHAGLTRAQRAALEAEANLTRALDGIKSRLDLGKTCTLIDTVSLVFPLRAVAPQLEDKLVAEQKRLSHFKARAMPLEDQLPLAVDHYAKHFPNRSFPSNDVLIETWLNDLYKDYCSGKRVTRSVSHADLLMQLEERIEPSLTALGLRVVQWGGARNRFHHHASLVPYHWNFARYGNPPKLGHLAVGGVKNKNDVELCQLHLTGEGCSHIGMDNKWTALHAFAKRSFAHISRIDIAFDDFDGKYGDVRNTWANRHAFGGFKTRGAGPKIDCRFTDTGDTINVGKVENGKVETIYQKGIQLGDEDSKWVRIESKHYRGERDLPLDMLLDPDSYFAGAYPVNKWIIDQEKEECIEKSVSWVVKEKAAATIRGLAKWGKIAYGKLIDTMSNLGMTDSEIVAKLREPGVPRRLTTVSFVTSLSHFVKPPWWPLDFTGIIFMPHSFKPDLRLLA